MVLIGGCIGLLINMGACTYWVAFFGEPTTNNLLHCISQSGAYIAGIGFLGLMSELHLSGKLMFHDVLEIGSQPCLRRTPGPCNLHPRTLLSFESSATLLLVSGLSRINPKMHLPSFPTVPCNKLGVRLEGATV